MAAVVLPYSWPQHRSANCRASSSTWFYTMFALCLAGLLGITITGDAFNIFVFLEISSLSTYVLIALGRDRRALLARVPVPHHGDDRRDVHRDRHRACSTC